ncbi:MAG: peptidylprolyl isomerase [Acidobacteria bacterium]|nr:peptidylprolyl isomerase [Acidobacteriota bacterium]MDA1234426.1 peptidylprolyl isomerase [Acidobacteriota bacterium]
MKIRQFVTIIGLAAGLGTGLPAQITVGVTEVPAAKDRVVISVLGVEYTREEVDRLRRYLPPEFRGQTQNMTNKSFLESFGFMQALAAKAKEEGVLEREPYRTQRQFNETSFLGNSYLQMISSSMKISDEDKQAFYDANPNQFQEVQVSAIYVNFSPVPELAEKQGKPVVLESAALEKAQGLHAQAVAGADFEQLARENSDDQASAAKGGDLGYFKPADPLAPAIKNVVFAMEVGDTSEPVKDSARFYVFRVTDKRPRPFADAEEEIEKALSNARLMQRLDAIRAEIKINAADAEWLDKVPGKN